MFKKILSITLCMVLLYSTLTLAKTNEVGIVINGIKVESKTKPVVIEGVSYVPLRLFFETLYFNVNWNNEYRTAVADTKEEPFFSLYFSPNRPEVGITHDFQKEIKFIKIDNAPLIINGSLYVPFRAFGDVLGASVNWDSSIKTASLNVSYENMMLSLISHASGISKEEVTNQYYAMDNPEPYQNNVEEDSVLEPEIEYTLDDAFNELGLDPGNVPGIPLRQLALKLTQLKQSGVVPIDYTVEDAFKELRIEILPNSVPGFGLYEMAVEYMEGKFSRN